MAIAGTVGCRRHHVPAPREPGRGWPRLSLFFLLFFLMPLGLLAW